MSIPHHNKSSQEQYVYQSGSLSASDTIIEEQWTESSTLSALTLVRITDESFDNLPFRDPSYGKDITKLTLECPCPFQAVSKALEIFSAIHTLEFGTGFFICEDFGPQQHLNIPILEFLRIKSLIVNYDPERYAKMNEVERKQMHLRMISLLKFFSGGLQALDLCSLSIPCTIQLESRLKKFSFANGLRRKGKIHYTGKMAS